MTELQTRLQSALGDGYRIEKELGGGGMSRVFLAQETRLGRQVVIKVLPPEMAAGVNVERFEREIQLAARLQHPHVVALLTAGVVVLAVAVAVLTVLVLALFRQVGVLEGRLGPRAALELEDEGPPLGRPAPPAAPLARDGAELLAFSSRACRLGWYSTDRRMAFDEASPGVSLSSCQL